MNCIGTKLQSTLDIIYTVYRIGTRTTKYIRGTKYTYMVYTLFTVKVIELQSTQRN